LTVIPNTIFKENSMRRLVSAAVFLSIFAFVPLAAQDRSPELNRLDYYVGGWNVDAGDQGSGSFACDWLGARVLTCDSEFNFSSGVSVKTVGVWSYNAERGFYTWLRYWGNGNLDDHVGWVDGDTWTWMQRDTQGGHYRFVFVEDSPTEMTQQWWRSIRGADWELAGNATLTKVR
jgi:hypothetical protein